MEKTYFNKMKSCIDSLINDGQVKEKAVFIFGHTQASEKIIDYLADHGTNVTAILDNNESKWGMVYQSVTVCKPDSILSYSSSASIVLVAAKAYESMAMQLRCMGYSGTICKVADYNSFAEYSLSEDTFNKKKERMLRGAQTLAGIRKMHLKQFLVICPYDALGDVYQALSFLPDYCDKHEIGDRVILVAGDACRQVAELFESANIMALDQETMDNLVQAVLFTREKNCIIAHHERPYTNTAIRYLDKHFLSFVDFYRFGVYGLGEEAKPALPAGNQTFTNMGQMEKGNTVILSPYAKSVVQLPESYWEALAGDYRQKGYCVCTNVAGDEKPVGGTKSLSLPINQMVSAAEYAGLFIGIRSGLCDILSTARCRKIVVFADCFYSTTGVKIDLFFDMPGWEKTVYNHSI